MGSQIGVVIAAIVMIGGFELFRELEEYRMLMFGLGMVADHDLAAARPDRDARTIRLSEGKKGGLG